MSLIGQKIEEEYRKIREENRLERERRIAAIDRAVPQIRALEDETYRAYAGLTAQMFRDGEKTGQYSDRIRALQEQKLALLKQAGYPEDYLDTIYTCPTCQDTGFVNVTPCRCYHEKYRRYLYEQANLSPIMQQQSFDSFSLDYYSKEIFPKFGFSPYDCMKENLALCRRFVSERQFEQGVNLLMCGAPGLGKTFLCSCIAGELVSMEVAVLYQTAYKLFSVLENHRFRPDELSRTLTDQLFSAEVLIIDDLGTEFVNSYTNAALFDLINDRRQSGKSTVISTNLSLAQIREQYSDRISSRLVGEYELLQFFGDDIRTLKKL